jgi:hypothetical protein
MDEHDLNQAEHPDISSSLDVEKLDTNLFRSKNLWLPPQSRGTRVVLSSTQATQRLDQVYLAVK